MTANPLLGVIYHWLGGLASGSFYVPYRAVRRWSWETYWLAGGVFSWIIAPWVLALALTKDVPAVLGEADSRTLFWTYFFGVLWGLGGLTFGLTMRYLGMSLGMAVALGFCAAFGTLMPPIFRGTFASDVLGTTSGIVVLIGVATCLVGIGIAGLAGMSKEGEMSEAEKKATIKEFNLRKGVLVAVFAGIMSACFAYGLAAGKPISEITMKHGTPTLWSGLPVLIVVLLGGFTTNFLWCVLLNIRNKTGYEYLSRHSRGTVATRADETIIESAFDAPGEEMAVHAPRTSAHPEAGGSTAIDAGPIPLLSNYFFSALAGVTWYFQFFFYSMGETKMGKYGFSSWTLHMASIIIFSSLWGIGLREWKGTSAKTRGLLGLGLAVLIASTVIVGAGNAIPKPDATASQPAH